MLSINPCDIMPLLSEDVWIKYRRYIRSLRRREIDFLYRKIRKISTTESRDIWISKTIDSGIFDINGQYTVDYMIEIRTKIF